ncbi:MAG: NAD-dependent protein deacylase [Propionicimonas sp.]|uniref:NAD-dependent protein deacylase n=1 Tax=Propionicimonas sp. TaxID=1955623 RepID=UPI003D0FE165
MASELARIIEKSRRIVFFGGAGVSTESGIPDFRSADGLYSRSTGTRYAPEEVLSHSFFVRHTAEFFDYYRSHLLYPDARPNAAHLALARLEQRGRLTAVITQNIDGLHRRAGSKDVLELHGSVHRNTCVRCGRGFGLDAVLAADGVPTCACGGVIKPDVVLYEEALDPAVMDAAIQALRAADTVIVGGTSLVVYPAAGLLGAFGGDELVLINTAATDHDHLATLVVREPIGEALGAAVP